MLPKLLDSRLRTILSDDYESVMTTFSLERKGSFRINTLKSDGVDVLTELKEKGIVITPLRKGEDSSVSLTDQGDWGIEKTNPQSSFHSDSSFLKELGYFFDKKDDYVMKGTDAFYQGRIYLQSISSMLPVLVLDPQPLESVLDVCAAPGSKTTQLAMMMGNTGKITALEQNPIRYEKLMHNCTLQGATIIEGKRMDARVYLDSLGITKFNKILLDAQCSAEGRISLTNDKTYGFWSLENIKKKAEVQYDLLSRALTRLEKGGTLVYSTCTLAPEENEGVISRVLAERPDISIELIDIGLGGKSWWREGITSFGSQKYSEEVKKAVRILPSEETEGFFIAKIMKW